VATRIEHDDDNMPYELKLIGLLKLIASKHKDASKMGLILVTDVSFFFFLGGRYS